MRCVLVLLLLALLSGCHRVALPEIPVYTQKVEETVPWQPQVLANTPDCAFVLEGCGLLENGDYQVRGLCLARGEGSQLFSCQNICLDGWQVETFWGQEIEAGQVQSVSFTIPGETLRRSGITRGQRLEFDLQVFSLMDLNQSYLVSSHCCVYPTGVKPSQVVIPEPSVSPEDRVLADNAGCAVTVGQISRQEGNLQIPCILENKTRRSQTYRIHNVLVNGEDTEPVWTLRLSPGTRCAAMVTMPMPEGVGAPEQVEFGLYVCRSDTWFGDVWVDERFSLHVVHP